MYFQSFVYPEREGLRLISPNVLKPCGPCFCTLQQPPSHSPYTLNPEIATDAI